MDMKFKEERNFNRVLSFFFLSGNYVIGSKGF